MSGDQFHLLSRGARLGVVSSGVAALGGGLLWRVGRWVAGAGGVVLSGSARWCGIGQAFRGRVEMLCCCGAMSHGSVRLGGREAGRKRPSVMFSAWRDAWRCCCMLLGRWHAISGELD
jgi:hypothetical protein